MKLRLLGKEIYIPVGLVLHYTRRRELALLLRYLNPAHEHRVADVACGDGYITRKYARRVAAVMGLDFNPERIREADRKGPPNSGFVVGAAEALPWADASFDRLISVCALEHFQDDRQALKEMGRVLKDDGVLAISVDSMSVPGIPRAFIDWHKVKCYVNNYYTLPKLEERLTDAGFGVTDWRFIVTNPYSDRLVRLLNRRRLLGFALFPLAYPLSLMLDAFSARARVGHKLVVRAVRQNRG
jgi:SAM-dependent methyltransferase